MVAIGCSRKEIKMTQFEHKKGKNLKKWNYTINNNETLKWRCTWKLVVEPKEEWNNIDLNPRMECTKIVVKPPKK